MPLKKPETILLIALFATLLLFSELQLVQAAPVVTGPYTSSAGAMGGGVRYKAFRNPGRVYMGPNMGAGNYPNRVETGVTWASPGTFSITFTYDKANDRLVTTVGATTLVYPSISTYAGYPGSVPPSSWNFLQITIANRGTGTTVNLNSVNIDTYSLGSFSGGVGPTGFQFWQVTNYDFSQGFTVTGTIQLAGTAANFGDETCKIEINVGYFAPPPALDHFTLNAVSSPQTAGSSFSVTVTAKDQYGNTLTSFTGSNTLSASTGSGTINPTTIGPFVSGAWSGGVIVTKAQAAVTIGTTDGGGHSGISNSFDVNPAVLHHFTITGYPSSTVAGVNFGSNDLVVTAYDVYDNVKTDHTGQVYFTSSDSQSLLPYTSGSKYQFILGDSGTHTFAGTSFTLSTAGSQTITITDGTISEPSSPITVNPGTLDQIALTPNAATITAGQSVTYAAQASDAYGNSLGDVTASTSWGITSGAGGSWSANFYTSEKSGTWTVTGTYSGKSDAAILNVNPDVLDHFAIAAISSPQTAGTSFTITITAVDQYGNTATGYTGPNALTDLTATITPTSTGPFTVGAWTGSVTITKAQSLVTITTSGSGKSETSNDFVVNHGPASSLVYVGGDGQKGKCNQECQQYLKVRVVDGYQNPAGDHALTWEITSYPTGAVGQRLSNLNTVTDQNGESFVRFRFGNMPGIYRITATGFMQYAFTLTAVSDPAPTPRPVGGIVMPTNKLEIVAPFAALAGLIVAVSAVVAVKRRRD